MTTPQLISPETWATRYFPVEDDRPNLRTVRKWIEEQLIPGRQIGRLFFVDEAAWLAQRQAPAAKPVSAYRV